MGKNTLGGFEHQVLVTVLRLGGEAYSVPVVLELEQRADREVSQAAVFVTLRRLEKKGLLESRLDDAAIPETGRQRRYFSITAQGLERLRESRRVFLRLWDGLGSELEA